MPRETITENGLVVYRTKLIRIEPHAESVARSLSANRRFDAVTVVPCPQAKGGGWFVLFRPTNPEPADLLVQHQQERRTARALQESTGYLFLPSEDGSIFHYCVSASGEVYETSRAGCSCPDFQFRCQSVGLSCKHMIALCAYLHGQAERAD